MKKKIGVKAVKGEEIGIAKGRESGGAAAVPQRTRRGCTAPAHPADRDKPPSAETALQLALPGKNTPGFALPGMLL